MKWIIWLVLYATWWGLTFIANFYDTPFYFLLITNTLVSMGTFWLAEIISKAWDVFKNV